MKKYPKKYQVRLNKYLVGHVADIIRHYSSERGVITAGIAAADSALKSAMIMPFEFCTTLKKLAKDRAHGDITLTELMTILNDPEAIKDVMRYGGGNYFYPTQFGLKTRRRLELFCKAACAEVDRGLFRA